MNLKAIMMMVACASFGGNAVHGQAEITTDCLDAAGGRMGSSTYTMDGCLGGIGSVATVPSPPMALKSGYIGQLYDPVGLCVGASPTNVNEATSRQLSAAQMLDDGTFIPFAASGVTWSVVAGPINSISPDGLATAGYVYQNTPATVAGLSLGFSNSLGLTVVNVTMDDFGLYAADGIDDDWQVLYFGEENPDAYPGKDPDSDGRDNRFESLALTVPTDPVSFFDLRARPTPAQHDSIDLIFGPIRSERNYTVLYSPDLSPSNWTQLTGTTQGDNGEERTVTDPAATGPRKFYKVQIGR